MNKKRREKRFQEAFGSEERVEWIRNQPCVVGRCYRKPAECAHVVSRAAGGTETDIVPLCHPHHRQQHEMGIETFQDVYSLDLESEAERIARKWEERN